MEQGGGANNASTSEDKTNYFSWGPSALLPTLLWLDADRLEALGQNMTQEKLDLQRNVVRNERRQTSENTPYGVAELLVPELLFPPGHPYHHPVIGSHQDLEAATVTDVVGFFDAFYVPANASLVVAGDFDPAVVRPLVEQLYGALPSRPLTPPPAVAPVRLEAEVRRVAVDRVELPRLSLYWHAPPAFAAGTTELELLARVLGEGPSSRLERRLVRELRLAESVEVDLDPRLYGSVFEIHVTTVPGADVERVKREVLAVLSGIAATGPTAGELSRAVTRQEVSLRLAREDLLHRADRLNLYRAAFGTPDGFSLDLARFAAVTTASVRTAARGLDAGPGGGRLDLRVLPKGGAGELPATHPADLPAPRLAPPVPVAWRLPSGVEVRAVQVAGTGLFSAAVVFPGAERAVPAGQAGASALLAELLQSGAGGRSATEFADALGALGASLDVTAGQGALVLSVQGLTRNLGPTLDLVADAVQRPTLAREDFEREKALLQARVEARAQEPAAVARLVTGLELFGEGDPRGRPAEGFTRTVSGLTHEGVRRLAPSLLHPGGCLLLVAGDVAPAELRTALGARFGAWSSPRPSPPPAPPPVTAAAAAGAASVRLYLVDRPGAPQTLILGARPLPALASAARAERELVGVALGGGFTSRLNQNLREAHGYSYGAHAGFSESAGQPVLTLQTSVQTEVTGPALGEIRAELARLAADGLPAPEAGKARETARSDVAQGLATGASLVRALTGDALAGRGAGALVEEVAALDAAADAGVDRAARGPDFRFDDLTLVLVGDRAAVLPQLAAAGLPAPTLLDAEGRPAGK
jgi:predicted Zn-dependent peptidase